MSVYGIPDEVYLRNRLDHLNQNSHYGIMIDTEITDIVRRHIKRLEDNKMKATSTETFHDIIAIDFELQTFPNPDVQDKFIVSATNRDDIFAFVFEGPNIVDACRKTGLFADWEKDQKIRELEKDLGRWKKEAADCLRLRDETQKEAYKLKKENEKYEEKIKKLEHDDMLDKNAADYWSKEHDILLERFAKLQVENEKLKDNVENLKKHVHYHIDDKGKLIKRNDELRKELVLEKAYKVDFESERNKRKMMETENNILRKKIKELEKDLAIEKAANEAQHKFIREYAGKGTEVQFNYAIDDAKEVSYVVVDKEEYNKNFEKWANAQVENAPVSTSREDILDQAKECVCGQREQDYGTPESNFKLIADLWTDYLYPTLCYPIKDTYGIKAEDVAMMMALMKIARIRNGGGSGDSFVDLAGYAACGGEIWHGQKAKDQN